MIRRITSIANEIKLSAIHLFKRIIPTPKIFIDQYYIENNAELVLYKSSIESSAPFAKYQPQRPLKSYDLKHPLHKVSLISTLRNEAGNVEAWVKSVFDQTRLPDEIIITDAGSTDGTIDLLKKLSAQSPVPFHVSIEPSANIAQGRNIAIAKAQFPIIATSDFGCRLHPDWLEKILAPFESDPDVEVSAGMYQAIDRKGNKLDRMAWWSDKSLTIFDSFLPSGRSCAFTKEVWKIVGGYPEWLSMTGEDTIFALDLKKYAHRWALVPEAIVDWRAPGDARSYWRKNFSWTIGDGESGVLGASYWRLSVQVAFLILLTILEIFLQAVIWASPSMPLKVVLSVLSLAVWLVALISFIAYHKIPLKRFPLELGGLISKTLGFIHGAQNRHQTNLKRSQLVKGTVFILSGVPIDDTGGGARCTQIALELLRQKYAVVFINKFPKYESVNLNLSIKDANLFTYQVSELDWDRFSTENAWLLSKKTIGAVVEMPLREFIPIIKKVKNSGGIVAYDLLDDWNTQLGGAWYSEELEAEVIKSCQVLLATAPTLAERLRRMSDKNVELLPNAVNTYLFNPERYYAPPADLPEAEWIAIYVGALWGEWFDWNLLIDVAKKYPEAALVVIGDYRGQCPVTLPNLHFLGLKKQRDIPAYLSFSDVAIIPWKVNKITQATSPLKIYEYLAMKKPVVSPEINPLKGIPGIYLAADQPSFVKLVGEVRKNTLPIELVSEFIAQNNWQARVNRLLELIQKAHN